MRVILTDDVADDTRRFLRHLVAANLAHRIQNAPMHRLQTVAHIGQCSPYDDAHGIRQIARFELLFYVDLLDIRSRLDFIRHALGLLYPKIGANSYHIFAVFMSFFAYFGANWRESAFLRRIIVFF